MRNMYVFIFVIIYFQKTTSAKEISHFDPKSHSNWNLLPHDICGRRAVNEATQALSSNTTYFGKYPWMVFLFDNNDNKQKNQPTCGGTIINNKYVLTTEYCCKQLTIETSRVRIGEFDISHEGEECGPLGCADPVKNLRIEDIVIFRRNNVTYLHDDVCLIRLKSQISFNKYVRPICLPVYENSFQPIKEGSELEFAGLTRTGSHLKNIFWPVISDNSCKTLYHRFQEEKICSRFKAGQESLDLNLCFENRGHSLMTSSLVNGSSITYVVGLYLRSPIQPAYNYVVCVMRMPKMFSKVTDYNKWILDNIKS